MVAAMAGVTVLLIGYAARETLRHSAEATLVPAAATILSADVAPAPGERARRCRDPHVVRVSYELEVGGERHTSSRYSTDDPHEVFCDGDDAHASLGQLRPGASIEAHVDPVRPESVVRFRRRSPLPWQILAGAHATLLAVQLALSWKVARRSREGHEV
jgi:hypothetical protein